MTSVLCIGIGNLYRQDDAVGLRVAAALRAQNLPGITVIEHSGEGASLMDIWQEFSAVILIDALASGAEPGTVRQLAVHDAPIPSRYFAYSTHAFGLAEALEMARSLNTLPARCVVFGIEGARFGFGTDLTPEVEQAAQALVPVIACTIERLQHDC